MRAHPFHYPPEKPTKVKMDILDKTIAEVQRELSSSTDIKLFEKLLEYEKKNRKRKVMKRWLKVMIKSLKSPSYFMQEAPITEIPPVPRTHKDPITGITRIG